MSSEQQPDLTPCPWCQRGARIEKRKIDSTFRAMCSSERCCAKGPKALSADDAAGLWNWLYRRANAGPSGQDMTSNPPIFEVLGSDAHAKRLFWRMVEIEKDSKRDPESFPWIRARTLARIAEEEIEADRAARPPSAQTEKQETDDEC